MPEPSTMPKPGAKAIELFAGSPYRLLQCLARGGMGLVFEAEHIALRKRVVVKLLLPSAARRPELVHRIRREARLLTQLEHPNLVAVTDLAETRNGLPYVVMERLYGRTLSQELSLRHPLPPHEAISFMRQALIGLQAAHEAGFIHRDIKLDNLFLSEGADGTRTIKVLDFGCAKSLVREFETKHPTAEGVILGTPSYLSPEQASARKVDRRTDVYGCGVALYRLLTGRHLFVYSPAASDDAPSDDAAKNEARFLYLLRAHAHEIPEPPSQFAKYISPALDAVVLKALKKRPEDRYQTAEEFSTALAALDVPNAEEADEPTLQMGPPDMWTVSASESSSDEVTTVQTARTHDEQDEPTQLRRPSPTSQRDEQDEPTQPRAAPKTLVQPATDNPPTRATQPETTSLTRKAPATADPPRVALPTPANADRLVDWSSRRRLLLREREPMPRSTPRLAAAHLRTVPRRRLLATRSAIVVFTAMATAVLALLIVKIWSWLSASEWLLSK